jgi:hypothetical protein
MKLKYWKQSTYFRDQLNKYLWNKYQLDNLSKYYHISNQLGHLSEEKVFNIKKLMCAEKINDVKNFLELT